MNEQASPSDPNKQLAKAVGAILKLGKELAATVPGDPAESEELFYGAGAVQAEQERAQDIHKRRMSYLPRLFGLVCVWLIIVVAFVFATSVGWIKLSDGVLIAFITSTTVSVLGLFHVAGGWLYPRGGNGKKAG